jgi:hypothetical protein
MLHENPSYLWKTVPHGMQHTISDIWPGYHSGEWLIIKILNRELYRDLAFDCKRMAVCHIKIGLSLDKEWERFFRKCKKNRQPVEHDPPAAGFRTEKILRWCRLPKFFWRAG